MIPLRPADPSRIGGYRLLGRLGAGGMGVVYLARSSGGALVALKVIRSGYADDAEFRTRFRREVAAARRVDSRWAVPLTDADTEADAPWLTTGYVSGPSLHEAVAAHGPLPYAGVATLGGRLAEALTAVHAAGLAHRDIKPGNVLLAFDGPRLIDFGIARALDDTAITATDMVIGSPGYLSPEQARAEGAAVGPPGDVFSLGCVLAFAASGRAPFGTGEPAALLFRTVHDPAVLDGVPEDLLPLLESCLDKDPGSRPSAADVMAELARATPPPGDGGWLPEPVTRLIAERSAALLALPGIEATETDRADQVADAVPRPGRRRFLSIATGSTLLAVGAGGVAWMAFGDDRSGRGAGAKGSGLPKRTIGMQADLSGAAAAAGRAQERGARLAVEQFNARAGRPFDLALKVLDDGGDPGRAKTVARRLTGDRSVLAVLGPTTDAVATAVTPVYEEESLPLLAVSVTTLLPSLQPLTSVLLARPENLVQAFPIAFHLEESLKAGRGVGLVDDRAADDYSQQIARGLADSLRVMKRPVVPRVVAATATGFGPVVSSLLSQDVAAVVYTGFQDRAARLAVALREAGFRGPRVGTEAVVDTRFVERAGEAAEGWTCVSTFIDPLAKPSAARFVAAHKKRYGSSPARYAAEAYDVVNLVAGAVQRAGGRRAPDRKAVRERLLKADYQGVTKHFSFEGEQTKFVPGGKALFLNRVQGGRFRFLGDAPMGD